jgi:hypothetical protein
MKRLRLFVHMRRNTLALRWTSAINLSLVRVQAPLKSSDASYVNSLQRDMASGVSSTNDIRKELEGLIQDEKGKELMANAREQHALALPAAVRSAKPKSQPYQGIERREGAIPKGAAARTRASSAPAGGNDDWTSF